MSIEKRVKERADKQRRIKKDTLNTLKNTSNLKTNCKVKTKTKIKHEPIKQKNTLSFLILLLITLFTAVLIVENT